MVVRDMDDPYMKKDEQNILDSKTEITFARDDKNPEKYFLNFYVYEEIGEIVICKGTQEALSGKRFLGIPSIFDILLLRSFHKWYDRRFDPLRLFLVILFVGIPLSFGFEGTLNVWTLPPFIFAVWLSVTRIITMSGDYRP